LTINTIPVGESESVDVSFTVTATDAGTLENGAEIASAETDNGETPQDIDSTPDTNPDNDTTENDAVEGENGDEDDDDIEPVNVEIFDLALTKDLAPGEDARVYPGEDVTFAFTVTNEGTADAFNVVVTDYLPACLTLNDGAWSPSGAFVSTTIASIPAGGVETVNLTVTVTEACVGESVVNVAEVSSAEDENGDNPEDIDSELDNDPNNPDEDDSDDEPLDPQLFDLALIKTLSEGQSERVFPGETVSFDIAVTNQGTVVATNVEITDYVPAGLTANGPTVLSIAEIAVGATEIITVEFTVDAADASATLVNRAEISAAQDDQLETPNDIDSTPDNDDTNDTEVNDITDNTGGDEDDADLESVDLEIFDLALVKDLADGQSERVYPGEDAVFAISVTNEGTVVAENVTVTDFLPSCLTLNDPNWVANGANVETIIASIAPTQTITVNLTVTVTEGCVGQDVVNIAEISEAMDDEGNSPDDNDSTPDTDPDNDPADEDDSDNEPLDPQLFDLAITKTLAEGQNERVYPGQTVVFDITVFNQGTVEANNVVVEDFAPEGLTIVGSSTVTIPTVAANDSEIVQVEFTVDANATTGIATNIVEIQSAEDDQGNNPTDNDSTPDNDPNNDPTEDNAIDNENGDEDDNDLEEVDIQIFDLALNKVLAAGEDDLVYPGEDITFTINVFNQGSVAAQSIVVTDYIPAGLTLNDPAWTINGGNATITLPGTLTADSETSVDITFTVDATDAAGNIVNRAEISEASDDLGNADVVDNDSTADDILGNDNGGTSNDPNQDDNVLDDGTNDEDDEDPEDVNVEIFDLALTKSLGAGQSDRVYPGQDITFDITVFNQGTVAASNIEIADFVPAGLTINDANWTVSAGVASIVLPTTIEAGSSFAVPITFTVNTDATPGNTSNIAEIQTATDPSGNTPDDNDSTGDLDPNNDPTTDGAIDGENGDEDDNDVEDFEIQIFDLALIKTLGAGEDDRVYVGEDITFTISVVNQGSVPAQNVEITDFIPTGLTLNDPAWTLNGAVATTILPTTVAVGDTESIDITFTVSENAAAGNLVNVAEISAAEDETGNENVPDLDSTPDTIEGNDAGGTPNDPAEDDFLDGNGVDDEDDSDPEDINIEIFDLALTKTLAEGEDTRVYPGEEVTFTITVFNQGTVPASNIIVEDYVPTGLTPVNGSTSLTFAGPIAAESKASLDVTFTVTADVAGTLVNAAEIQSAEDENGDNPDDVDSVADNDPNNDPTENDEINDDGVNDEDDLDIEEVEVSIFDLASNITLAEGEDDRVYPGETVSFKVTVFKLHQLMVHQLWICVS